MTTLHVDPAYLEVVAGRLQALRRDLEHARTSDPGDADLGPEIVAALDRFRRSWNQGLDLVDRALERVAHNVGVAACRYASTDGAVERAYRS